MAYGAFDGDVEPGGLRDRNEVKILICYLLKTVKKPLSFDNLNEITHGEGLVNYFELAQAVKELLETGHIDLVESGGSDLYKCTRLGAGTADLFERTLPFSVREKAVRAAVNLLARIKRETENKVEITENPGGGYCIKCRILDVGDELMNISLSLPEKQQADMVRKQFLKNPEIVYKGVLALLTGDLNTVGGIISGEDPADRRK